MSPSSAVQQLTGGAIIAALTNPASGFPQITVAGEPYELRYTFRSAYFLETVSNLPAHELSTWIAKQHEARHITTMMMTMTGAMLGRAIDGKWKSMPITGEELSDRVLPNEWQAIMAIYTAALKKVSEGLEQARMALQKKAEPTAEPTPEVIN